MPSPSPVVASVPNPGGLQRRLAGPMLWMLVAVALFGLMDAGLKLLAPHYPPLQVAALRGASALPLVLIAWAGSH